MTIFERSKVKNVGIIAMEVYYPKLAVHQTDLEKFDGASEGKYTVGLGQLNMGFCDDVEDINSICLTVFTRLIENYNVSIDQIGRLEVGTETIIDHSKSVKSCLMQLFESSGNTNVEGLDTTNACYGGTQALFNSLAWVESSAYDGRFAVVICGDIAVYSKGPARPTGGAGCVAMLIGLNAPLVVRSDLRTSHFKHAWDFYKPQLDSEYPTVDGKLSIECYLDAIDQNYNRLSQKTKTKNYNSLADFYCFHSPYTKLVLKSYARLAYNDFFKDSQNKMFSSVDPLLSQKPKDQTYFDRDVEKAFLKFTESEFSRQVDPSLLLAREVGNTYTGSLYCGLVSLLSSQGNNLCGKRACLFSYGSGLASSMFIIEFSQPDSQIYKQFNSLSENLSKRKFVSCQDFEKAMLRREKVHGKASLEPLGRKDDLWPKTFYLKRIDEKFRRFYAQLN